MWSPVWYHPQILDAMFSDMFSQHSFVNGERIGNVALPRVGIGVGKGGGMETEDGGVPRFYRADGEIF